MSKFKKNLNRILNDQLAINLDLLKGVHLMTESFQLISARIDKLIETYNRNLTSMDADLNSFAEDITSLQERIEKLENS